MIYLPSMGIEVIANAAMQEITDNGIIAVDRRFKRLTWKRRIIVLALGMNPNGDFYEEVLSENVPRVFAVGDCREIRNIYGAVWDGFEVGRNL